MRIHIIGAGIFGLATALELRSRGHSVCVFEQDTVGGQRASSTDLCKVIRRTNYQSPYLELVERAARQWQTWHRQLSGAIYYQTGKLTITREFGKESPLYKSWEVLGEGEGGLQILSLADAQRRYPAFAIRPSDTLIFDPWAGYLRSSQALEDLAGLARSIGVQIREETPVLALEEQGSGVVAKYGGHTEAAEFAVVAAGPWVARLCPDLGQNLRVSHQQMAFFKPTDPTPYAAATFPVWTLPTAEEHWYGFPYLPEGLVKIAGDRKGPTVDPDTDRDPTPDFLTAARNFVEERIPSLANAELVGGRSCLYTNTPDNDFVIDRASSRILVAGCGSGHGFKFGGSIGPLVADMLEDKDNPLGDALRIGQRFAQNHTRS